MRVENVRRIAGKLRVACKSHAVFEKARGAGGDWLAQAGRGGYSPANSAATTLFDTGDKEQKLADNR